MENDQMCPLVCVARMNTGRKVQNATLLIR